VPEDPAEAEKVKNKEYCFHDEGVLIDSGEFTGLRSEEAREKIVAWLEQETNGREVVNYKIRDWLISRQRYWGAPIPIIHCPKDGPVAVPEDQLPVKLPELTSYEPSGDGRSPLATIPEFVNTTCPKCGGEAQRETDTMDGFACSSWYFLRFADPNNDQEPFSKQKAEFWLPVDDYIGGAEHAVMHLLYARFWTKVMHDEGLINFDEPFKTLRNHGMILAPDGAKMSKSKGNTIEPGGLIEQGYGADSIRLMELFIGPWNQVAAWSVEGMGGTFRFLQRVWAITGEYIESEKSEAADKHLDSMAHKTIKKVSQDLEELGFNTSIAALMEYVNELYKIKSEKGFSAGASWKFAVETLVQLLAPFAPHISEELWMDLGREESVHMSEWPVHDETLLAEDNMTIVVQVNGKLRANVLVPTESSEEAIIAAAKTDQHVTSFLNGEPKKTIYIPGKLVNFVV
jgi:leucyl-tRNA synthetase